MDPQIIGAIFTGIAVVLGGWATVQSRRTEAASAALQGKTATREEIQQILNAQAGALDRQEKKLADQEKALADMTHRLETAIGERAAAMDREQRCEERLDKAEREARKITDRLRIAEARITELGG